jgi:hypothetical protein
MAAGTRAAAIKLNGGFVMRSIVASRLMTVSLMVLVSVLVLPGGSLAAKPETIQVDDTFVDEFLTQACGFEVTHSVTGTIRVSENAEGLFLARFSLKHTLTGSGGSLSFPDVGIDKLLTVADDGVTHVETVMSTGVLGLRIVVPGEGIVAANTGREIRIFTFDSETGEFLSFELAVDSGLDSPLEGAALESVCTALAG